MAEDPPLRRQGGRSARVRAAVHDAVNRLVAERGPSGVTVADVAVLSGVHATSIYRRWGTMDALLTDVAMAGVEVHAPLPDTGALRSDLLAYATQAAMSIGGAGGFALLRVLLSTHDPQPESGGVVRDERTSFIAARGAAVQAMLDKAKGRGERELDYTDVLDGILAPLYMRFLFHVGGVTKAYLVHLVDRVLTSPLGPRGPRLTARVLRPRLGEREKRKR